MFLHCAKQKATVNGWATTIFKVPTGPVGNRVDSNLLTQYGEVFVADCRNYAASFLGRPNKASQESNDLKLFLDNSLSHDIMLRLLGQGNRYVVDGVEDGVTMLRVLISLVGIESAATVSVIRACLRTLPAKMTEVNSKSIVLFNEFVRA